MPGSLTTLTRTTEQTGSRRVNHGIHPETLKPEERIEVAEDLPLTDCYVAPVLLPALSSKIFRNTSVCLRTPLCRRAGTHLSTQRPARHTGHICDHQCQYNCTRLDYDMR